MSASTTGHEKLTSVHFARITGGRLTHAIEGPVSFGRIKALCGAEPRGGSDWNRGAPAATCEGCLSIMQFRGLQP